MDPSPFPFKTWQPKFCVPTTKKPNLDLGKQCLQVLATQKLLSFILIEIPNFFNERCSFKGQIFLFMMLVLIAFKIFENTFMIWPYEDQMMFLDTKNMCMYTCMYICIFLFVCLLYLCAPYIQKHPKCENILKNENLLAQDKMTHSLAHLTFLVDDDEHVHACLIVEKFGD